MTAAERELVIVEIMRQREKPLRELSNEELMELAQRGIKLAESLGYGADGQKKGEAMKAEAVARMMVEPAGPNLAHEARVALLGRWKKYLDPNNLDWNWEKANRYERHAINAVLDLEAAQASESALVGRIRDALITDQATGAGDYSEAEEYADRIIKQAQILLHKPSTRDKFERRD